MTFGFLKHYRKIKIEGVDPSKILNKCLKHKITLEDLRWKNDITYTVRLQGEDYKRLKQLSGHNCKLTVLKEGGAIPLLQRVRSKYCSSRGCLSFRHSAFLSEHVYR